MSFVVRRVNIGDEIVRAGIDTMIAECFEPSDWQGERLPKAETGYWWVAFEGKAPVGFASLRPSIRMENAGYLSVAGVLPAWRGKGLQKRLIKKRIEFARSLGWHTVITDTLADNVASMCSLIACGFRPFMPQTKWNGAPERSVFWKRPTDPKFSA